MPLTAQRLATLVEGTCVGEPNRLVSGVASLRDASADDVSFFNSRRYLEDLRESNAGTIFIPEIARDHALAERRTLIICADPSRALQLASNELYPPPQRPAAGIHPSAIVAESARIDDTATVGPHCVIESHVSIGPRTLVDAGTVVREHSVLGSDCHLHANVTITHHSVIGNRVVLHSGVVIGADGYGYHSDDGVHNKIPQIGIVQIDDDVEIGANSCVDRARFAKTWIQRGTKIDNLVQVGHNAVIGEDCLVVALTGIAGSARLEQHVTLAGMVGVIGHCELASGTVVGAGSIVMSSIEGEGRILLGEPAIDRMAHLRQAAEVRRLPKLVQRVKELEARLADLEQRTTT